MQFHTPNGQRSRYFNLITMVIKSVKYDGESYDEVVAKRKKLVKRRRLSLLFGGVGLILLTIAGIAAYRKYSY